MDECSLSNGIVNEVQDTAPGEKVGVGGVCGEGREGFKERNVCFAVGDEVAVEVPRRGGGGDAYEPGAWVVHNCAELA